MIKLFLSSFIIFAAVFTQAGKVALVGDGYGKHEIKLIINQAVVSPEVTYLYENCGVAIPIDRLDQFSLLIVATAVATPVTSQDLDKLHRWVAKGGHLILIQSAALVVRKDKSYEFGSGYEATRELLQISDPPTAIFALSDNIAVGVADGIKSLGLKIPEDVSLIGYDNKDFTQVMAPELTTVFTHFDEIGEHAATLLIGKIENPDFELKKTVCTPELVIRESCAERSSEWGIRFNNN